jgi:hypothetical protein
MWHNSRDMSRWFWFFIAIAIGILLGLFYGWRINPVKFKDFAPDSLGVDYKTDYVLMIAEAYSAEQDPEMAIRRLAVLGNKPPVEIVREAILFAENPELFKDKMAYPDADLEKMRQLEKALAARAPIVETPSP